MRINWMFVFGCILIALKITEYITWSWWIVLLPFYLPFVLTIIIVSIAFACGYSLDDIVSKAESIGERLKKYRDK